MSMPALRERTIRPVGHDVVRGGLRFLAELVAWVAVPWALWPLSIPLAIGALLLLIVPPTIFSTPGDRPGGDAPVAAPGIVTVVSVLSHLAGATIAAWAIWPSWLAAIVTALSLAVVFTEQPRWRALGAYGRRRR